MVLIALPFADRARARCATIMGPTVIWLVRALHGRRLMLPRAWHRVRQFFGALRPRVTAADRGEAYRICRRPQQPLFEIDDAARPAARHHRHAPRAHASPDDDRALLAAALLHDCGKGRVALWQRVAARAARAVAPGLYERIASRDDGAEWRRGVLAAAAPSRARGATWPSERAPTPTLVRMIREQDAASPDARLAVLQAADDA